MLDIPRMEYFKKNTWCGSHKNKRCRIAAVEDKLVVAIWDEPFCFEATAEDNKAFTEFEFTSDGLEQVKSFLDNNLN